MKRTLRWAGSHSLRSMLGSVLHKNRPMPPDKAGVYVVSLQPWSGAPTTTHEVIYVGSNTGGSTRFKTRIGDLIADVFGFYSIEGRIGHHSGGRRIHKWCKSNRVDPLELNVGWAIMESSMCHRCLETELYDALAPKLCVRRPPRCKEHPWV